MLIYSFFLNLDAGKDGALLYMDVEGLDFGNILDTACGIGGGLFAGDDFKNYLITLLAGHGSE